jgi:hypothetical protein
MSHVYCPECGFQNPEAANFCSRCGAILHAQESGEVTQAFSAEEASQLFDSLESELELGGVALVVRSGGRAGESFAPQGERTTVGRSPDCQIFLDDVTVSRRHAVLLHRHGSWLIEDQGSLNGTFVNRRRVESAELHDGDELQIGKYRLTFVER